MMMKKTSRYERLGRMLLKCYGFSLREDNFFHYYDCKPKGPGIHWNDPCVYCFNSWKQLLFGRHGNSFNLNKHIKTFAQSSIWKSFKKFESCIIDFKSLDELEVKLALAGISD